MYILRIKKVRRGANYIVGENREPRFFRNADSAYNYGKAMKDMGLIYSFQSIDVSPDYSPRIMVTDPGAGYIQKKQKKPVMEKMRQRAQQKVPKKKVQNSQNSTDVRKNVQRNSRRRTPVSRVRSVPSRRTRRMPVRQQANKRTVKKNVLDKVGYSVNLQKISRRRLLMNAVQIAELLIAK